MSVFYVFQGVTYQYERDGGYVWSPKLAKNGSRKRGFENMTLIKTGDFILHNFNSKIMSLSVATSDCYGANQPSELYSNNGPLWNDDGYRVDLNYYDFDVPLSTRGLESWLKDNYDPDSAFTVVGRGKQQYMCKLANKHATFILSEAIKLQTNPLTLQKLKAALAEIIDDSEAEYDEIELEDINRLVEADNYDPSDNTQQNSSESIEFTHTISLQATNISSNTGRITAKRDPLIAAKALKRVNYICENDPNHQTFLRKNNTPYTEPHHLIPISKYKDFNNTNLDTLENIVSLCSNCHNLLHYGRLIDKKLILEKLLSQRIDNLKQTGINITLDDLLKYYK